MKKKIDWFRNEEDGQGMVEYGLIIALVAMAIIGSLSLLGVAANEVLYEKTISEITF
ncbi:Flp family type IVb pilin [Sedimentibacter sp.]|uniref:Flp family type IVb pilin n=1 Tax=Sedimentibacter sp. TaxID=1960295 RepID=UPI0028AF4662|nr:Flp family type IVb pilin [Sedimentibacter sp.]